MVVFIISEVRTAAGATMESRSLSVGMWCSGVAPSMGL